MPKAKACLVLHPVQHPNHGPHIELSLAEEAIGLAKAMRWSIIEGPYWKPKDNQTEELISFSEPEEDVKVVKEKPIKNGDYIYTDLVDGVYY